MCVCLQVLLQHGKKLVQEGALTAMASVADCSNQLFIKYYDTVMPLLLSILVGANDKVCEGAGRREGAAASQAHGGAPRLQRVGSRLAAQGTATALPQRWLACSHVLATCACPLPPCVCVRVQAHRLLRGKALECISLVGMAVGRDRFRADAQRVLQWLQALQSTELEADDPTLGYMLQVRA